MKENYSTTPHSDVWKQNLSNYLKVKLLYEPVQTYIRVVRLIIYECDDSDNFSWPSIHPLSSSWVGDSVKVNKAMRPFA